MSETTCSVRLTESTRVETFSDGVMAIVITILALELRVAPHEPGRLLAALESMWGSVLAFLISFLRQRDLVQPSRPIRPGPSRRSNAPLVEPATPAQLHHHPAPHHDARGGASERRFDGPSHRRSRVCVTRSAAVGHVDPDIPSSSGPPGAVGTRYRCRAASRPAGAPVGWREQGVAAAVAALMSPAVMLVLWTPSLIFLAATSGGGRRQAQISPSCSRDHRRGLPLNSATTAVRDPANRERQYLPDVDPYRFELRGARRSADL